MATVRGSTDNQKRAQDQYQQMKDDATHTTGNSCCHSDSKKKKKVEVIWPQDCAFVGQDRAELTYEALTLPQFTLGYLRSLEREPTPLLEPTWWLI